MSQNTSPSQEDQQSRDGSTDHADVWVPRQSRSSEQSGPIPRPFAHGSVVEEQVVPAPRGAESLDVPVRSGGVLAPPRPAPATAPAPSHGDARRRRRRSAALIVGGVLAIVLLLAGLYAAAVGRAQSPDADQAAPVAAVHDVTYRVTTAGGSKVVVSYSQTSTGDYATGTATGAPSPWSVETRVSDYYGASITATVVPAGTEPSASDTVTCSIVQNGRVVAEQTATGPDASVSCVH